MSKKQEISARTPPKRKAMSSPLQSTLQTAIVNMYNTLKKEDCEKGIDGNPNKNCNINRGEVVTAAKIFDHMNENYDTYLYKGSKTSLQIILKDMGFVWPKGDPFAYIRETEVIFFKRSCFLREYMRNKDSENPKPVVFLDETWIFMNGSLTHSWNKPQKSVHDVQGVIRGLLLREADWLSFMLERKKALYLVTADIRRNEVKHAEEKIVEFYNNEVRDVPEVEELVIHHGSRESEEEVEEEQKKQKRS